MRRVIAVGIGLAILVIGTGRADERVAAQHQAARNALGVLQYCQARGLVDQTAVAAQQDSVNALPPVTPASLGHQEEEDGRLGYLSFGRRQASFAESASAQGIAVGAACAVRAAQALAGR